MFPVLSMGQYTLIPDQNFEQALINLGFDSILDGQVITNNIDSIDSLNISNNNISDLTGIDDFTALKYLFCQNNPIGSLNLTQNNLLVELDLFANQITYLDLTQNVLLNNIYFEGNPLVGLDLSNNVNLIGLWGNGSDISCLNIKNGNNTYINNFYLSFTPNLTCIQVDDPIWATNNLTNISQGTTFALDCNYPLGSPCNISTTDVLDEYLKFNLFPNPTKENITISIENFNGNIKTEVYDLIGNKLQTTNKTTISLNDYSEGIYILKLAYGNRVQEVKVIKE